MKKHIVEKTRKRAFTLAELLIVMLVSSLFLVVLYSMLNHSFEMYESAKDSSDVIGSKTSFLSDVALAIRECEYVEVSSGKLLVYKNGSITEIDPHEYGIEATAYADSVNQTVILHIGGEEFCLKYLQGAD